MCGRKGCIQNDEIGLASVVDQVRIPVCEGGNNRETRRWRKIKSNMKRATGANPNSGSRLRAGLQRQFDHKHGAMTVG